MRQIKFRGKCNGTGEWVRGDLQLGDGDHIPMIGEVVCGYDPYYVQVEEYTIGQFTGLYDKDGIPIYEGDILSDGYVKYEVWYSEDKAGFVAEMIDPQNNIVDYLGCYDTERIMAVISNIHDKPELIKNKR